VRHGFLTAKPVGFWVCISVGVGGWIEAEVLSGKKNLDAKRIKFFHPPAKRPLTILRGGAKSPFPRQC
jgi:hypothetical protein